MAVDAAVDDDGMLLELAECNALGSTKERRDALRHARQGTGVRIVDTAREAAIGVIREVSFGRQGLRRLRQAGGGRRSGWGALMTTPGPPLADAPRGAIEFKFVGCMADEVFH